MGAGCSNGRALAVQDSVTKKITLTQEGKDLVSSKDADLSIRTVEQARKGETANNSQVELSASRMGSDRKMPTKHHRHLWEAVETNDIKVAEELLEMISTEQLSLSEADLYDSQGNSMAHKAASLGHAEVLMLLLERTGAKPDIANAQLSTPLHLACKNNRESVAKFLIGCGVDVNGQDENGQTPLLICCIHGNTDLAQLIIESSASGHTPEPLEIDARDHRGLTPLNCAAIKGDLKQAKLLIEKAGANVEVASPKGCTPLIYAARGGYSELLEYLVVNCKASPLKQDSSGATFFHHAIEKGNLEVLMKILAVGSEFITAIEIADNAGRTPIFEAIDNNVHEEILKLLILKRAKNTAEGGFGAKINVLNYNGQTPVFSAVREGNMELLKVLVEIGGAEVDKNGGEMVKDDNEDGQNEEYESIEERNFMDAYKNCMTPLHLACILGLDEIALYLIERGEANPNLQTSIKGYCCLHLAVLANKPEMLIELLTRTNANPHLPDYSGRTFIEMVETHLPDYLDTFTVLLENLQIERLKRVSDEQLLVATHYYNPDDEREIKGLKDEKDLAQHIEQEMQMQEQVVATEDRDEAAAGDATKQEGSGVSQKRFLEMEDAEIEVEESRQYERDIEVVFGRKIALGLIALNFKYKEIAMKIIIKHAEKLLSPSTTTDSQFNICEFVRACAVAVDCTCREKVIKVFNLCLQLLTLLITSAKVEQSPQGIDTFKRVFTERNITLKLLQRSEEGNTRLTNKIHECLLDYSFHPRIGEAHVASFILQRINSHNKQANTADAQASAQKPPISGESRNLAASTTSTSDGGALGSYKGLLAQLALLYKFVNSFGVSARKRGPLNAQDILNAILPSLSHQSQDVRSASTKILLDVQRLSGAVQEDKLIAGVANEKIRNMLLEKVKATTVEREQNQAMVNGRGGTGSGDDDGQLNSSRLQKQDDVEGDETGEQQQIQSWTGSKDQSLKAILEFLNENTKNNIGKRQINRQKLSEEFLTNTTVLLKSCLEDNNFNLYIQALEVASAFFYKALFTEVVLGSLQSLIKPIVLRTTDTNTRLRKKSVEIINQIWSQSPPMPTPAQKAENQSSQQQQNSVPVLIADVICDQTLQERAIIGRLGLFIKRASTIELGEDELSKKPHQVILGRNYEQLMEFACAWSTHKNIKVRQNALKLIVEVCRVNSIDPRGLPFKQRIINMILMLRASLRDQLVTKINEVCSTEDGQYINVQELELTLATKSSATNKRAASMEVNSKARRQQQQSGTALPEIGGLQRGASENGALPQLNGGGGQTISLSAVQPQLVLPHSEPLSDEQKIKYASLIELFGIDIIGCFNSQSWSNRQVAIEKVEEQLHNLDPNRRDAMSAEINRKNLPIEENFKIFLEFIDEGSKDPVLKNLISIIDLLKKALPTFFRYIQPNLIKKELMPLVSNIIKKTTDLKAKVRELAIDFSMYLSHQSPIGPEVMVNQVLQELELVLTEQSSTSNVAASMGNSHMISSCFKLLNQFQQQTKILDKSLKTFLGQSMMFNRFIALINASLRHQNPQVRKEGEALFKTLYLEFGEKLDQLLVNQKQQVVTKLVAEAKQEAGITTGQQQQEINIQRAQTQSRTDMFNQASLSQVLKGQDENLQALRLPNVKKRQAAVVELRKAVQKELMGVQGQPAAARALFEPLSVLIRQLLSDEEPDIYLETLVMLRAVVGALVPHMSTLDVHLMLGSFIGVIVANTVSGNIRTQIASDKVIIFFAKHSNIGPFVVAKDILKNIEKCIKTVQGVPKREEQLAILQDKKATVIRFLSILQLLLQHFSIVLCYQTEFYDKCIDIIADSMLFLAQDDQSIKNICVQLIVSLQKIDSKLLEQAIQKLDFSKKTPLRKAIIELEHQSRAGKNVLTQDHHAFANQASNAGVPESPMKRDTRGSNMTESSRTSLFSPGATLRGASPGGPQLGMTTHDWARNSQEAGQFTPQHFGSGTAAAMMNTTIGRENSGNPFKQGESRAMRRMISLENENPRASQMSLAGAVVGGPSPLQNQARQSVKFYKEDGTPLSSSAKKDLVLPDIVGPNMVTPLGAASNTSHNQRFIPAGGLPPQNSSQMNVGGPNSVTNKMSINATGGAGFSSSSNYLAKTAGGNSDAGGSNFISGGATSSGVIRPPLYVPQKRDNARAGTGMLSGTGVSGPNGQPQQQMTTLLNRTGPLPTSYQPPVESKPTPFKTEFNSNLYANVSSAASTSGTSSNMGVRSSSLQKKPLAPLAGSTLFKAPNPQNAATFETNVTRYKEPSAAGTKGVEEFF